MSGQSQTELAGVLLSMCDEYSEYLSVRCATNVKRAVAPRRAERDFFPANLASSAVLGVG